MIRIAAISIFTATLAGCLAADEPLIPTSSIFRPETVVQTQIIPEIQGELSLREAIELTLSGNPQLKAYGCDIYAAQARELQARFNNNPELGIEVENFGGSGDLSGFDSAETTLQLSQLIQLGNKVGKRVKLYTYDSRLTEIEYRARELEILKELTKAYIENLFIAQKEKLALDYCNNASEIANTVDKRVQAGKDSPLILAKAQMATAKAKLQHQTILKYASYCQQKLSTFWAGENTQPITLSGKLETLEAIPARETLNALLDNNPELIARAVEIQRQQVEVEIARSQSLPDVTIGGGIRYANDSNDTAFVIGLSMPLSNARQNRSIRKEASHNADKAQYQQQASQLYVWNECNRLYTELENSYTKADLLMNDILKASEDIYIASKISYEQGKTDYLTLLDSQKMFFDAKGEYIDALAAYHIARTELECLLGRSLKEIQ